MPADPRRVKELFVAAVDLPDSGARIAFLESACGDDADLRHRVELLLRAHSDPASILDQPLVAEVPGSPGDVATGAQLPQPPTIDAASATEGPGTVIGRYKLLEQIGEGGFGV